MKENKLIEIRETYHTQIRNKKSESLIKQRRRHFISAFGETFLTKNTQRLLYFHQMISSETLPEGKEQQIVSQLASILSNDVINIDFISAELLKYLLHVNQKCKNKQLPSSIRSNLLECLIYLSFQVSDISPFEGDILNLAVEALGFQNERGKGILLLNNITYFDGYPNIIKQISDDKFLDYILSIIEDFPLDDKEKLNVLSFYQNLVFDKNGNTKNLAKHLTILYSCISDSCNDDMQDSIIGTLKVLIKKRPSIINQIQFEQIVCILIFQNIQKHKLKQKIIQLLVIFIKRQNKQLIQRLLQRGLLEFLSSCTIWNDQKSQQNIVKLYIEILKTSQYIPDKIQIVSQTINDSLVLYLKSYEQFTISDLKKRIIQLLSQFDLSLLINQNQFLDFLQNFDPCYESPRELMLMIGIIDCLPIQKAHNCSLVQDGVMKVLQKLSISPVQSVSKAAANIINVIQGNE